MGKETIVGKENTARSMNIGGLVERDMYLQQIII